MDCLASGFSNSSICRCLQFTDAAACQEAKSLVISYFSQNVTGNLEREWISVSTACAVRHIDMKMLVVRLIFLKCVYSFFCRCVPCL